MNVNTEISDRILRIVLDRPDKRNAITAAMYGAMADALRRGDTDPAVRAILIQGRGDVFTAGNDLRDFMGHGDAGAADPAVFRFLDAVSHASKPLVAAVNGAAVGIGTTLLLHCDLVYAGESARFQLPFVRLGLCPEAASSYLLPRLMGHPRAAKLLMLGDPLTAREALAAGMVTEVLADGEVLAFALAQARRLAELPPEPLRITKYLMKRSVLPAVEQTMPIEHEHFKNRLASPEAREALTAFFEGRAPDFSRF